MNVECLIQRSFYFTYPRNRIRERNVQKRSVREEEEEEEENEDEEENVARTFEVD